MRKQVSPCCVMLSSLLFGDARYTDKLAHFAAYGALGAAAFWAQLILWGKKRWTPLALAAYGALLEGLQGIGRRAHARIGRRRSELTWRCFRICRRLSVDANSRSKIAAVKTAIIIPARYGSTRLEGKPLLAETGKPLIQHTYEQAKKAACATQVIVATDDERILMRSAHSAAML